MAEKDKKITGESQLDKPQNEYTPKEDEKTMLEFVYKRFDAMKSSKERQDAEVQWRKGIKAWEAYREPKGDDEWQSNHVVPLTSAVIESALAEVIDQSPKPSILPRGSEDAPKATVVQHMFEYAWDVSNSDLELYNTIKDAFIYGTGISQEYYFRDPRLIQMPDGSTKRVYCYDDVYLESIKLEDFYIDENARDFVGPYAARDCVRRFIMDIDDYKNFFQGSTWDHLGNTKYVTPGGDTSYPEWYKPPEGIDKARQVEVLWYWAVKPKDWLVIVANGVVQVMGPKPYNHKELPFARTVDVKRTHKFYGKGESEILESVQNELDTMRRMVIDRNHLDIDKMFFVSSKLNMSDEDTIARPHGTIQVDDVNGAKAVEYGDIPRSVQLSIQNLQDDATIATGINPRAQALPTAGTATEAAILKESTLKRIRLKVKLLEQEFLTRVGRLRLSNMLQYYPQTKIKKIVGESGTSDYQNTNTNQSLFTLPGEKKQSEYVSIPIKGKSLEFDAEGKLIETPSEDLTFLELKPEYYEPSNNQGFDIKFIAGSTLPVSKPLMQSKATEMYDRLIQLASSGVGYDPVKLGDMLLKVNDFNPNDYHLESPQTPGQQAPEQRNEMLIQIANFENRLIMSGKEVPATAYATPMHTQIHVAITGSPEFQKLSKTDPIVKNMISHIVGELAAQESRASGAPMSAGAEMPMGGELLAAPFQQSPRPQGKVSNNTPTKNLGGNPAMMSLMPGKIQGGAQARMAV